MNLSDLLKLWRVEKASPDLAKMPPQFYSDARELLGGSNNYEKEKAKGIYDDLVYMRQHKMLMGCLRQMRGGEKTENLLAAEKESFNRIYNELVGMKDGRIEGVELENIKAPLESGQETFPDINVKLDEKKESRKSVTEDAPPLGPGKEQTRKQADDKEEYLGEEKHGKAEADDKGEKHEHVAKHSPKKDEEVFKGKTENKALKRVRFLRPMPAFIGPDLETLGPFDEDQVFELDGGIVEILMKNDAVELA